MALRMIALSKGVTFRMTNQMRMSTSSLYIPQRHQRPLYCPTSHFLTTSRDNSTHKNLSDQGIEKGIDSPSSLNKESTSVSDEKEEKKGLIEDQGPPDTAVGKTLYYLQGYKSLSKAKLGLLVLSTTMGGYAMAPGAFVLSDFAIASVGTWFTICAANSTNQIIEVKNDTEMYRTKKRWLPTNKISVGHAKVFAATSAVVGVGSLLTLNPLTSALAGFNLFLYTSVYTPLKQKHALNTWVGAVVGAIPPMIGWAACTGGAEMGSWLIGALLCFWQMPHFMALSYYLKEDYRRGGFRMLINTHPEKVSGVIMRYSLAMIPLGALMSLSGITSWWFALDSLAPTGYLTYLASRFSRNPDTKTAKKIFRFSLVMLPIMMGLMIFHKNSTQPDDMDSKIGTLAFAKENVDRYLNRHISQATEFNKE